MRPLRAVLHGDDLSFQRPGIIIVSAYDAAKCKRIIVDGIHQAAVITRRHTNQTEQFPTTIVYKWNGPFLNTIFPCDFCHLYIPEAKTNNAQT